MQTNSEVHGLFQQRRLSATESPFLKSFGLLGERQELIWVRLVPLPQTKGHQVFLRARAPRLLSPCALLTLLGMEIHASFPFAMNTSLE